MKKSLIKNADAQETIERASKLQPTTLPLWGTMSATAMLMHLNGAMKATIEGKVAGKPSTTKQLLLKFLMLNILPKFPKFAKAPARLLVPANTPPDTFQQEKDQFIHWIKQFVDRQDPIVVSHPRFGRLKNKEWGVLSWMHVDHHLRQFGL